MKQSNIDSKNCLFHFRNVKNLIYKYRFWGLLRLTFDYTITMLFFRPARLIRLPVYIRGKSKIVWGSGFTCGVGLRLDAFGEFEDACISIGDRVQINDYVHIGAVKFISIGNDVLIASKVFITDHNHGAFGTNSLECSPSVPPALRPLVASPVNIGDKVWIGENVSILAGVTIGEGAVIGAGAIVTSDIPPNCVAVGNPAKVIKIFDGARLEWVPVKNKKNNES